MSRPFPVVEFPLSPLHTQMSDHSSKRTQQLTHTMAVRVETRQNRTERNSASQPV